MNLTHVDNRPLASRLKSALRAKYGSQTAMPDTSALLLDISGSMEGSPIMQLSKLAGEFTAVRRFEFSSICEELPADKDISKAGGGTNLAAAFLTVKNGGVTHVVLITDGQPDSESLAIKAAEGLRVDVFYVGPDPAPEFLRRLCGATGGQYGAASLDRIRELTASVRERLQIEAPKGTIAL